MMYLNVSHFSKFSIQLVLIVLFLLYLVPITPIFPTEGLDPSWRYVIDYASIKNMIFGDEIVFTYGPLGTYFFPFYMYNPENYYFAVFFSSLFSLTLALASFQIVYKLSMSKKIIFFMAMFVGILMSGFYSLYFGFLWFFIPVFLVILSINRFDDVYNFFIIVLLLFFLSFSVLVKFSHFPTAILSVLIIDFYRVYRLKKIPFFTLLFIMLVLVLFVFSGQQIYNIGSWFFGSLDTLTGYSESMQYNGNSSMVPIYLILAFCFYYFLYRSTNKLIKMEFSLVLLLSLAVLFMAFKNGFVRHDAHAVQAVGGMVFVFTVIVVYFLSNFDVYSRYKKWLYSLVIITVILSIHVMGYYQNHASFFHVLSNTVQFFYTNAINAPNLLSKSHKDSLDATYVKAKQQIKEKLDLSDVSGTVDIYPWDQAYVLANDLNYRPRPLFQSYSVYTPALIQKNREFLYSDRAPKTILFAIKEIDNRLPAMMEGASWLDIMKLYDVVGVRYEFLQLQKTSHSKDYSFNKQESVKTLFNDSVKVLSNNVFVKINLRKNLIGSLVNLFYKMPITEIELEYENGSREVKRLIPGIASSGFIISPSINNINDFAAYASGSDLPKVVSFKIVGNSFLYDNPIEIEFFSIERKGFSATGLFK